MGQQRNLTEENVGELSQVLAKMKETNPELEYKFFKQEEEPELEPVQSEEKQERSGILAELGIDSHTNFGKVDGYYVDVVTLGQRKYGIKIPERVVDSSPYSDAVRFTCMKCAVDAWLDGMKRMKGGG